MSTCIENQESRVRYRESSIKNSSSFLCFLLKVGCSTFYVGRLSSVLTSLRLSRELYKSNLFMKNKANYKIAQIYTSTCITRGYENFRYLFRRKNKTKQSQFKPNFELKLGSFFQNKPNLILFMTQYWLCFSTNIAVKWLTKYIKE